MYHDIKLNLTNQQKAKKNNVSHTMVMMNDYTKNISQTVFSPGDLPQKNFKSVYKRTDETS
jgi:hypothetical protein